MYLTEQKALKFITANRKKKKGDGKCKIGALLHFTGKNNRSKCFSKKLKVTGIKCRDK